VHIWAHICKHTHTCTHIHTQLQAAAALAPCLKHQAWTCCCSAISCSFIIPCHGRRSPSPHAPRPQKPCRCMFVGSPSTTTATLVRVRMCLSSVIFVSSRLKWPPVIYASLPYQSSPGGKRNPNAHTSSPPPPTHTFTHDQHALDSTCPFCTFASNNQAHQRLCPALAERFFFAFPLPPQVMHVCTWRLTSCTVCSLWLLATKCSTCATSLTLMTRSLRALLRMGTSHWSWLAGSLTSFKRCVCVVCGWVWVLVHVCAHACHIKLFGLAVMTKLHVRVMSRAGQPSGHTEEVSFQCYYTMSWQFRL